MGSSVDGAKLLPRRAKQKGAGLFLDACGPAIVLAMSALTVCPSCRRHVFVRDEACPHCAQPRVAPLAALVVSAGLGLTACAASEAPVVRETAPATTANATVNIEPAPQHEADAPPVAVYGPPPIEAKVRRQDAPESSALPSASASANASPKTPLPTPEPLPDVGSGTWHVKKGGVPVPVYGPPPRDPPKRLP